MNDLRHLERIEQLIAAAEAADAAALQAALTDGDWRIVQAALHAVRWHPVAAVAGDILDVLVRQDALPLRSQDREVFHQAGAPFSSYPHPLEEAAPATRELWKCRWRVKQAACLALGAIGPALPGEVRGRAIAALSGYAVSAADDYHVRAAACDALGRIGDPAARAALDQAAGDEEWCTRTHAARALRLIQA